MAVALRSLIEHSKLLWTIIYRLARLCNGCNEKTGKTQTDQPRRRRPDDRDSERDTYDNIADISNMLKMSLVVSKGRSRMQEISDPEA